MSLFDCIHLQEENFHLQQTNFFYEMYFYITLAMASLTVVYVYSNNLTRSQFFYMDNEENSSETSSESESEPEVNNQ